MRKKIVVCIGDNLFVERVTVQLGDEFTVSMGLSVRVVPGTEVAKIKRLNDVTVIVIEFRDHDNCSAALAIRDWFPNAELVCVGSPPKEKGAEITWIMQTSFGTRFDWIIGELNLRPIIKNIITEQQTARA